MVSPKLVESIPEYFWSNCEQIGEFSQVHVHSATLPRPYRQRSSTGSDQNLALQDYLEASLMLHYNHGR